MDAFDKHTEKELSKAPLLRSLKGKRLLAPPKGYFDGFLSELRDRIEEEEVMEAQPTLRSLRPNKDIGNIQPPKGYFDALGEKVQDRIEAEMFKEEAPVLASLKGSIGTKAPVGYFDRLPRYVEDHVHNKQVVSFPFVKKYTWQIAASILVLICFGWLVGQQGGAPNIEDIDLTSEELLAYVETEAIDPETILEVFGAEVFGEEVLEEDIFELDMNLSEKELEEFVDELDLGDVDIEAWVE